MKPSEIIAEKAAKMLVNYMGVNKSEAFTIATIQAILDYLDNQVEP